MSRPRFANTRPEVDAQEARTLPARYYTDAGLFEDELRLIHQRMWLHAGRAEALDAPGRYFLVRFAGVNLIVLRGEAGDIAAFHNTCRHRGTLLCREDSGRVAGSIQCPYHAWTYGLDGCLLKAPRSEREPGFDSEDYSLFPVQVDTSGPFIFVNADLEADSLGETVGVMPETIAETGIDLDSLEFHHRGEYVIEANWKIAVENYLECYHCAAAHPSLAKAIDVSPDAYGLEIRDRLATQIGPARNGGGGVYDAAGEVERGQFHFLFPSTVVNVMPGRPNLSIGPIVPRSPERTYRFLDYFVERGHTLVPSSPLVLTHPTAPMFANAGMNQFVEYLAGELPAPYPRAASVQKCVRLSGKHNDIAELGKTRRDIARAKTILAQKKKEAAK